jgi:hypothetical protein
MNSRFAHLPDALAYQPAVDGCEQLPPSVIQARVGIQRLDQTNWRPRLTGHIPKQLGEGARLKLKYYFKVSDGRLVRSAATFLPLPDGAARPPDSLSDHPLGESGGLASSSERLAEDLALLPTTVHGREDAAFA